MDYKDIILFLASHPGGIRREYYSVCACHLNKENKFLLNVLKYYKQKGKCLFISAYPDDYEDNDEYLSLHKKAYKLSGLEYSQFDCCDKRNPEILSSISEYNLIILGGGHVPTQNKFFKEINLKEHLKNFKGIIIGISAGTMNSAEIVYAQPELEGEAVDKNYQRFINGLGLTKYNVLPHYYSIKDETLDGLKIIEDITIPDSKGRKFYLLPDGSYILQAEGKAILYGEAFLCEDCKITKICEEGESIELKD